MFATHEPFRFPIQLDDRWTTWRAVEVELNTPWYMATVRDLGDDVERTFLLSGGADLLLFASQAPFGPLVSLRLVLSPSWSPSGDWAFVNIRSVDMPTCPPDGAASDAVVTSSEGTRYGGYPITPLVGDVGPLERLVTLSRDFRA